MPVSSVPQSVQHWMGAVLLLDDPQILEFVSVQVKYLMGLKVPRFDKLQDTCRNLVANLNYFNWREYVVRVAQGTPARFILLGSGSVSRVG